MTDNSIFTMIKDIALIVLSALAILSSYIQSERNRRENWISEFRKEIANFISIITTHSDNLKVALKELNYTSTLITLYLNDKNAKHSELRKNLDGLLKLCVESDESDPNYNEAFEFYIGKIQTLSKEIISEKQDEKFLDNYFNI